MKTNLDSFGLAEIKDWVFDLDNTIYPASSSLFPRVAERMTSFIMEHFNLDAEAAAFLLSSVITICGYCAVISINCIIIKCLTV